MAQKTQPDAAGKKPPIRNLEKDAAGNLLPFKTSKHAYNPIKVGAPIGIRRWTEYEKLRIVLGTGKTFSTLLEVIQSVELLLASDKPLPEIRLEAILTLNSLRRGLVDLSQSRFNQAFYLATIFIIREGDDPLNWSLELAERYIEDWASEGISEHDLFFFALNTVTGFREHYKIIKAELDREAERLSDISGLKPTDALDS